MGEPTLDAAETTKRNLVKLRDFINDAHPAALADDSPAFNNWMKVGFAKANVLADTVTSKAEAIAVLRLFAVGFEDKHLGIVGSADGSRIWAGWLTERVDDRYVVAFTDPSASLPLPPTGSEIVSCDKAHPEELLRQDIAPFLDMRLSLGSTWDRLAPWLTVDFEDQLPVLGRRYFRSCVVRTSTNELKEYKVSWRPLPEGLSVPSPAAKKMGVEEISTGVFWVTLTTFLPSQTELVEYEEVLRKLRSLPDPKLVVFDVRDNNGGNSLLGSNAIRSLVGISRFRSVYASAQSSVRFRVSQIAIDEMSRRMADYERRGEGASQSAYFVTRLHDGLTSAMNNGERWFTQPDFSLEEDRSLEPAVPYDGDIAVLTSSSCASACLDFVRSLRRSKNVVQFGESTDADTRYNEVALVGISPAITAFIPLKVRVDRYSESGPSVPSVPYTKKPKSEREVRNWVLGHY